MLFMAKTKVQNISTKDDAVVNAIPLACSNEKAAVEFMEKQRWGDHPACPGCGSLGVYQMRDRKTGERQANFRWRCRDCKEQFTVRKGTVLEDSAIPLRHWAYAFWRAATSKKGVSALEIKRHTGLCYKSSLFLLNRIRHAMAEVAPDQLVGTVEADETYFGRKQGAPKARGWGHKMAIFSVVERNGRARSFHLPSVTSQTLKSVLLAHVDRGAHLMTDDAKVYRRLGKPFASHNTVKHSAGEYARDGGIHSNTAEGFFSIMKRGLNGIYHNVSEAHLHRYLAEFDFRYTNRELSDGQRTALAIKQSQGKRLMYADPRKSA
jgi:transposase-like protein